MPKKCYKELNIGGAKRSLIEAANAIIAEYAAQGYSLTVRQVYYQFVARDLLPASWADPATGSTNCIKSYKKLADYLNDGRLAGLVDWNAIEDRTREAGGNTHWSSPGGIIAACASQFAYDKWDDQEHRVEIWVEKDALEGVIERTARELDLTYFSCRGYASQSAIWAAAQRLRGFIQHGQNVHVVYLGDHDPSGLDMRRDLTDRLKMFLEDDAAALAFNPVALSMKQVKKYNPPENPAKSTDSRYAAYRDLYGESSWELDALDPKVIDAVIKAAVKPLRNNRKFAAQVKRQEDARRQLTLIADNYDDVIANL